jgi:hypothetical protein
MDREGTFRGGPEVVQVSWKCGFGEAVNRPPRSAGQPRCREGPGMIPCIRQELSHDSPDPASPGDGRRGAGGGALFEMNRQIPGVLPALLLALAPNAHPGVRDGP